MMTEPNETNKQTEQEKAEDLTFGLAKSAPDIIKQLLKDTNVKELLEILNRGKIDAFNLQQEESKKNLSFWQWRFVKEFLTIMVILGAIYYLSNANKIDACTVGTLLGSIIGYALGNFSSINKDH